MTIRDTASGEMWILISLLEVEYYMCFDTQLPTSVQKQHSKALP